MITTSPRALYGLMVTPDHFYKGDYAATPWRPTMLNRVY
jgi:hypothetical protein